LVGRYDSRSEGDEDGGVFREVRGRVEEGSDWERVVSGRSVPGHN